MTTTCSRGQWQCDTGSTSGPRGARADARGRLFVASHTLNPSGVRTKARPVFHPPAPCRIPTQCVYSPQSARVAESTPPYPPIRPPVSLLQHCSPLRFCTGGRHVTYHCPFLSCFLSRVPHPAFSLPVLVCILITINKRRETSCAGYIGSEHWWQQMMRH